jgi:hypothetical protein
LTLEQIKIILALHGVDIHHWRMDFSTPNTLAVSLLRANAYGKVNVLTMTWAKEHGLLSGQAKGHWRLK